MRRLPAGSDRARRGRHHRRRCASAPRGMLTLTAPVLSGEMVLRPILDAFLDACPTVSARLLLLDRPVNLIDEGIDVALRIAHLADSSMVATRVGEVRRLVVAAPRYLKQHPRIAEPGDLPKHQIVAMAHLGQSWTFPPPAGSSVPRTVQFAPRLVINSIHGAVASAVGGRGVGRLYSYQVAEQVARGRARDRAGERRGSADACASDLSAGPALGAEGAHLHGLCGAQASQPVRAHGKRSRRFRARRSIVASQSSADRPIERAPDKVRGFHIFV